VHNPISKTTIFAAKNRFLNISPEISDYLHQYFDKIILLSIPRFTDRHQRVEQHLKGLAFEYFWGADKLQLDHEKAKGDGTYDEQRAKKLQRQGKALNLGEIACSLSHRYIYEKMISEGWKKILILEDDALPCFNDMHLLPQTLSELPGDWELVYLGYLKHEEITPALKLKRFFYKIASGLGLMSWSYKMVTNLLPRPYSAHLKKAGFHDCTHAYAITLEAAKKLAAIQTPVVYRADDLLSATIMKGELNAFITDPKFFDQEIFHNTAISSDIRPA
jgi:glycosyl transferase family 25